MDKKLSKQAEQEPVALPDFPEAISLADLDYAQHEKPDGWDDGHFKTWQDLQVCQRNKTSLFKYAKQLRELILNSKRINQEPVAWGRIFDEDIIDCICPEEHALNEGDYTVPLYAAPQPMKQEPVCKRCAGWGIVPIGDGYSVDPCPDCAAPQHVQEPVVMDESWCLEPQPVNGLLSNEQAEQEPVTRKTLITCIAGAISKHMTVSLFPKEVFAAAEEIADSYAAPQPVITPDVCGEVCARAKLCYGCGKALDEANASWMSHEELKAYWSGYGNGKQKALSKPVAFIGQGLIPIVPEDLEKLRKYEPGTATLYDTPLYAAPVSAEAIRADQRQKDAAACYLRANSWKDNAARAAKLCGDAIMAGVQT